MSRENDCVETLHTHVGICQRAGYANGQADAAAGMLTDAEREVVELAGRLWNAMCAAIPEGPTRSADLHELVPHIHAIQHAFMANAAARAYPDEFRRLGSTLRAQAEEGGS